MNENEFIVGTWVINDEALTASRDGGSVKLSPKEFGILRYLSRRHDKIVTRAHLNFTGCKPRSIDVEIKRLRDKLQGLPELETIYGAGYCLTRSVEFEND